MNDNMNIDKRKLIDAILNSGDKKINKNSIDKAAKGDVSALIGSLDEENRKKLLSSLNDKKKAKKILSSKEAREIMKNLSGGKKDG